MPAAYFRGCPLDSLLVPRRNTSSDHSERLAAVRAKAKNREVIVERSHTLDPQPAHDSEARAINEGKILIGERNPHMPHTVIGVLPSIPQYPRENDVYMPTSQCPQR
jgi:hypothetical protein